MKRIFFFILLLTALLYFVETNESIGLNKYKPLLSVNYYDNQYTLTWPKVPYFAYYEVEVLNISPADENEQESSSSHRITKYRTFDNTLKISQNFPGSTYLRVAAHSFFHKPLGFYSDSVFITDVNAEYAQEKVKPVPIAQYPQSAPAPSVPLLTWKKVSGAVYYEIEFLSAPAENPNDIIPSRFQLFSSREVFTNGYSINLANHSNNPIYWRVRALNYSGGPIGVFSDTAEVFIDHALPQVLKPIISTGYKEANMPMPLYPVYSWLPINGAVYYEVEVTSTLPENPNGILPSKHRIRNRVVQVSTDCYDEEPLITPGTYYWRVRGVAHSGMPIGVYSDAEEFIVDRSAGAYSATFGDSITHGGGAVSYSPADVEYSFQTYLSFP
ncbi:MAG: GDSL family lipase, partial [Sporomusaceae bacterium]|nr:GDSL family lipase [Sporomusaceae bacterium]